MAQMAQFAQAVSSVAVQRRDAVSRTIGRIRQVVARLGITRAALQDIKALLLELAARRELFPRGEFPLSGGKSVIYRLAEDADHSFALYMSCGVPGKRTPPHDHTTWAVIAGVEGDELNFFYERADDRSAAGKGTLRKTGEEAVRPGAGVTLLPEDIHHIETGATPNLHLHMYGRSLEHLPDRVQYNVAEGTYKVFPANPNIVYMS